MGDDAWHLHSEVAPPASFATAALVSRLSSWLSLPAFAVMLPPLVTRLRELRSSAQQRKGPKARIVFWMLLNVASNVMQSAVNLFVQSPLGASAPFCRVGQKHAVVQYGVASWAGYWVLLVRAEQTLDRRSSLHMLVYKQSKLALQVGMPLVLLAAGVLFEGRVLFGSTCSQEPSALVSGVFIILDLSVTVLLVLLFYIPVRRHANAVKATGCDALNQEAAQLHDMARRTLRLSLLQQSTMFAAQTISAASMILTDDSHTPELSYLRPLRWVLYAVSLLVNTFTMLAMSSAWLPRKWRWWRRVVWGRLGPGAGHQATAVSSAAVSSSETAAHRQQQRQQQRQQKHELAAAASQSSSAQPASTRVAPESPPAAIPL